MKLEQKADGWHLSLRAEQSWRDRAQVKTLTTALLGKAKVTGGAYKNPDGSPLKITTDYFGKDAMRGRHSPARLKMF